MQEPSTDSFRPSSEQLRYAEVLEIGMKAGLACLCITFALYVFGIMKPHIPLGQLPEHLTKNVHDYLIDAKVEPGWAWVTMLRYGDFFNFIGITLLAGVTVVCYLAILRPLLRRKDVIYTVLAVLEVIVLVVAASGVIAVGH
jgi:hypothetical protein